MINNTRLCALHTEHNRMTVLVLQLVNYLWW